ncbi:MAG: hypothetical protein LUG50_05600 [Planctomycetaceae bacterium]|nr:hypothetical protein [Planctomycetaceae bacterium]
MIPGMRFIEKGPLIPGDLLTARDRGRVVFVCGAGVSRAKAGIPDFPNLTNKVCQELKVSDNPEYKKLLI